MQIKSNTGAKKRECFHSLSVRLLQLEQSCFAQAVEQLIEPCNNVIRAGCVCHRCRRFRTWAGRAGWAGGTCFTGWAGWAGGTYRTCFASRTGWASGAYGSCFTSRAGWTGSAYCTCFSGRASWASCTGRACRPSHTVSAGCTGRACRTDLTRETRRSRRTRNASRPHRSHFSSRSARTRRPGRAHRTRSAVAHHLIAHTILPAVVRAFPVAVLSIVHVVLPFLPICRKSPAVQSMPWAAPR